MVETIELRDIRVFLTLADELHFGRTAERLGCTASRVSQTIRLLETRLGAALFDRTSRSVRLTPLGEQLVRTSGPAYAQFEKALTEAHEAAHGVAGTLRLGMYSPVVGGAHLVDIIKTFEERHPACSVQVIDTGFRGDQFEWLRRGDLDVLAMRLPVSNPDVVIGPVLSHEDRVIAVATNHALAREQSITLEDLGDCVATDCPTLPRELMDAFVPETTSTGRKIVRRNVWTLQEAITLVALGEVVHPTVRSFADYHGQPGITIVPISDLPASETALMWLRANTSANVTAFADAATAICGSAGTRRSP